MQVTLDLADDTQGGYWSLHLVDVTTVIQALSNLDGDYEVSDVAFDVSNPPYLSQEGEGDDVDDALTPAGTLIDVSLFRSC